MKRTIFTTPVVSTVCRWISLLIVKVIGWRVIDNLPEQRRFVLIGAPHTSNWDFIIMLLAMFIVRMEVRWMGKDALFNHPLGFLMYWAGGISIDRSKAHNTVEQMVEYFDEENDLVVLIPPEGTRSKVKRWKTGFYHIANGSGVPILQGFVDAGKKEMGFGPLFFPTGDIEKDLPEIQLFYKDKQGFRPELQ
jgi:1-acyl-sn-glycerol-3-phosphate acyltransferase